MPLVTTRSVVLQTHRYSDTSKILRLMTLEHGPRSALAHGALRPRSRFGGLLEPFAEGDATLYMKENRELHTLSGFELVRERRRLGANLERYTGASVLCELVLRLAPEHRDDRLYHALTDALDALLETDVEIASAVAVRHIWRLVGILGFAPDLSACLECGRPIAAGEPGRFDFAAGGIRCARCSPSGKPMDDPELRSLRALVGFHRDARIVGPQARLVCDFIRYHLSEGTRLRSLRFLEEIA